MTPRRRWNLLAGAVVLAVAVGLVAIALVPLASAPAGGRGGTLVGRPAPALEGELLSGGRMDLADTRGRLSWVNFWAVSCEPCRTEMPAMQRLTELYGDRLVVLGVNWGEDPAAVRDFVARYGVRYPILLDPRLEAFDRWRLGVDGLPRHYFVDGEGTVVREVIGPLTPEQMLTLLDELLGPPQVTRR